LFEFPVEILGNFLFGCDDLADGRTGSTVDHVHQKELLDCVDALLQRKGSVGFCER